MATFTGFPKETLAFLRELGRNNNKTWFDAHREDYHRYVLDPATDLVVDLGAKLRTLSKDIYAEPRINGSVSRINRDIRFSKDKSPYKTYQDLWFWQGAERSGAGYWFRLRPDELMLGVGMHMFDKPALERYRGAVADPKKGGALAKIVAKLRAKGYQVGGKQYKRVPAGYDAAGGRAELLLHAGMFAGMTAVRPREVHRADFADFCFAHYRAMAPLQEWLVANVA